MRTVKPMLVLGLIVCAATASAQDFTLDPNYGVLEVSGGFTPDPQVHEVLAGGSQAASNADSGCTGYISDAPDFNLRYSATEYALSLFVDADVDTVLVVNAPDGSWHCNDDSEFLSGNQAGVLFVNPASGRYDVWVGVYSESDAFEPARLVITETGTEYWAGLDLDDAGTTASPSEDSPAVFFGDDTGYWAEDGQCDDPRFSGTGSATRTTMFHRYRDAADCRAQYENDVISANGNYTDTERASLTTSDSRHPERGGYSDTYTVTIGNTSVNNQFVAHMTSDAIDTYLEVLPPDGNTLQNDDYLGSTDRSLLEVITRGPGDYVVRATSYGEEETGSYLMDIDTIPPLNRLADLSDTEQALVLNADSKLTADGKYAFAFEFFGQNGEPIDVYMGSEDFDTQLILVRPDGSTVTSDDADDTTTNSHLQTELNSTGPHMLLASSFFANSTGNFSLRINPEAAPPVPQQAPTQAFVDNTRRTVIEEPELPPEPTPEETEPTEAQIQFGSKHPD